MQHCALRMEPDRTFLWQWHGMCLGMTEWWTA
jgi:hypothetical protein